MTDEPPRINLAYLADQLRRAAAAGKHVKADLWRQVLAGISEGKLSIGSRTPVEGVPTWITPEVLLGGFATGNMLAAGPLQPHELQLLERLNLPAEAAREQLNTYFLSGAGGDELVSMLERGTFRLDVPEEAALLVLAWLMQRGHAEQAATLATTVQPFADRLRFYPRPHAIPTRTDPTVSRVTVGESIATLRAKEPQLHVLRMHEAITVWAPLHDRAVALFDETVQDGVPLSHIPAQWSVRARALLDEYQQLRKQHTLCAKPDRPKENFARLRSYLVQSIANPSSMSARDLGMLRKVLATSRRGDRLATVRAEQRANVAQPLHHELASAVADRLQRAYAEDEGAPEVDSMLPPRVPASIARKARRCLEAPLPVLVERNILPSADQLATVLPTLSARVGAQAIEDEQLRRVWHADYVAFRRRRSLLLLNLESQIRFDELPWIAAIEPWVRADEHSRAGARQLLSEAALLSIEYFPSAIVPNKLVRELRALASQAGEPAPLVYELAADIFQGAFNEDFLRAGQVAAELLRGSLYARYYDLPIDRLLALDDLEQTTAPARISPGFLALCRERAERETDERRRRSAARNGVVLEQAQILTTHNLAVLFSQFGVREQLQPRLPDLAERCLMWIFRQHRRRVSAWRNQMQLVKNTAYAWRQMIFFLSFLEQPEQAAFHAWALEQFGQQPAAWQARFKPAMDGLAAALEGQPVTEHRFLGWSLRRHWLLPPAE